MDNERHHQEVVFSSKVLKDIKWLIQQVERLEKENKRLRRELSIEKGCRYNESYVHGLEDENKRYREALEQIANSDGWLIEPNPLCTVDEAYGRCVEKARKALGREE